MEDNLSGLLVIGAFVGAYLYDKRQAEKRKQPPALAPAPYVNPENRLCRCYQLPVGSLTVLLAGERKIHLEMDGGPSYLCQGRPLNLNPPAKTLKMAWRVAYGVRGNGPRKMERNADGNWISAWVFTDEDCSCWAETIYHEPGRCRAEYSPSENKLTLLVTEESKSRRIGPP